MPAMTQLPPKTRKFIDAIYRRLAWIGIAENIALGGGIGAVVGLLILPIFWWRGQSGWPAVTLLILGSFCGFFRGIVRRPTRLEAAVEADRQLKLHDLLGTVLLIGQPGKTAEPDWQTAILTMAENRIATLRPSDVLAARLGLRTWGGIGVLTSLLLTLSILSAHPADLRAAAGIGDNSSPSRILALEQTSFPSGFFNSSASPNPRHFNESQTNDSVHQFQQDQPDKRDPAALAGQDSSNSQNGNGGGGTGLAVTQQKTEGSKLKDAHVSSSGQSHGSELSGGNGKADASAISSATSTGGAVDQQPTSRPAAPWKPGSPASAQGTSDGNDRPAPDGINDLLKDYFQRD
jgi:hypothetical protein